MPEFYTKIARIFFSNFGGGHVPPVSYAYAEKMHFCDEQ